MTYPYGQQPPPGGYPGQQPQWGVPSGGFPAQQPYGAPAPAGYPGMPGYGPRPDYASWGQRVGAYLIDALPVLGGLLLAAIGFAISVTVGIILVGVAYCAGIGWVIYNRWVQAGRTGQSLGKRVMNIRMISDRTGQPIGGGMAFVRDLCHVVDGWLFCLGYLWPLWDDKSQTFSDKIIGTIVLRVPPGAPPQPGYAVQQQPGYPVPPAGYAPPQQAYGQQPPRQW
ncbi:MULTISPECIES: RDD family protein [Amycolatopsis]|uniref:RDD family protein n=1 Tax=Amycolatopsis TaxID=1813 RepID=UPI0018E9FB13|nr:MULTISPECIES: RDD family protein [Amycolatopsis]